jgi:hypothetical protein
VNLKRLLFLDELEKLGLPKNDYAIGGSAPLVIRYIKEKNGDIDIIVKNKLWSYLIKKYPVSILDINGEKIKYIEIGNIALLNSMMGFSNNDLDKIIERADVVDGYRFLNLDDTNT